MEKNTYNQGDHMIPRDILEDYANNLEKWNTSQHKNLVILVARLNDHHNEIKKILSVNKDKKLINFLPQWQGNLVNGYRVLANVGNLFDPEMIIRENQVVETEVSLKFRELDKLLRYVLAILPDPFYLPKCCNIDDTLFNSIKMTLKKIENLFLTLRNEEMKKSQQDIWYIVQNGKWCKLRCGELIETPSSMMIPLNDKENKIESLQLFFNELKIYEKYTERLVLKNKKICIHPVFIYIKIVPSENLAQHIYERHYYPSFAGTVESINTFWKEDPSSRIPTIMDDIMNDVYDLLNYKTPFECFNSPNSIEEKIQNPWKKVEEEGENIKLNGGYMKYFIQGYAQIFSIDESTGEKKYFVLLRLNSLAPQNHKDGYVVKYNTLKAVTLIKELKAKLRSSEPTKTMAYCLNEDVTFDLLEKVEVELNDLFKNKKIEERELQEILKIIESLKDTLT